LGKKIAINPSEVNVPSLAYGNLDPDNSYYLSNSVDSHDEEFNEWKSVDNDQLPKLLWPADDIADDLEKIVTKASEMTVSSVGPPFITSPFIPGGRGRGASRALEYKPKK